MKHLTTPFLIALLLIACTKNEKAAKAPEAEDRINTAASMGMGGNGIGDGGIVTAGKQRLMPFITATMGKAYRRTDKLDFDNNGLEDFAKVWEEQGEADFDVHLSRGNRFDIARVATRQGGLNLRTFEFFPGDYNGDGRTDVAKLFPCGDTGTEACVDVHLSQANNTFRMERWATTQGGYWKEQRWFSGDFDGDRKDDLMKCWSGAFDGHEELFCDAHLARNGRFDIVRFATRQGWSDPTMQFFVGDFTGDGKTDIAKVFYARVGDHNEVNIDVHVSTGSSFSIQRWATKQGWGPDGQTWYAGDFNGDGKADLMKRWSHGSLNEIFADVHYSTGQSFTMSRWINHGGAGGKSSRFILGDFTGDRKIDMAHVFPCGDRRACADVHFGKSSGLTHFQRYSNDLGYYWDSMVWNAGYFAPGNRASLAKYWSSAIGDNEFRWSVDVHPGNPGNPADGQGFGFIRFATHQGAVPEFPDRYWMRFFPEAPRVGSASKGAVAARFKSGETVISSFGAQGGCASFPGYPGSSARRYYTPDGPPRAYQDLQGRIRLIVPHYLTYAHVGRSLLNVGLDCGTVAQDSAQSGDPDRHHDTTWLSAPYRLSDNTFISLNHNEYHLHDHTGEMCTGANGQPTQCWFPSITLSASTNGINFGVSEPNHIVARAPNGFAINHGAGANNPGYGDHTNIMHNPHDGFYYAIAMRPTASGPFAHCLIRSHNPGKASSWRQFNGENFYSSPRHGGPCQSILPLDNRVGAFAPGSLSFSKKLNRFVYLVFGTRHEPEDMGGYYMFLSQNDELTQWSAPINVLHGSTPWGLNGQKAGRTIYPYPSFLDPNGAPNFDVITGDEMHLHFVRWTAGSQAREVVRIPMRLVEDRGEFDNRPRGFYRVGGRAAYSNGLGEAGGAFCNFDSMQQLRSCGFTNDFNNLPSYQNDGDAVYQGRCQCGN